MQFYSPEGNFCPHCKLHNSWCKHIRPPAPFPPCDIYFRYEDEFDPWVDRFIFYLVYEKNLFPQSNVNYETVN